MNKSLFLLLVLLLTGCASFQVSTLNHDPIYAIEGSDAEVTVIDNEFELRNLLRTDFNFRYNFAQYAISQPRSFDWNNRRWSSNQWGNPYGWNNYYGWNNGFYNRYRGTNVAYHTGRRGNTRTINRRVVNNNRVVTNTPKRDIINNKPRVINNKPRVINNKPRVVIDNKPRINNPRPITNPIPRQRVNTPTRTRSIPNTSTRSNNSTPIRSNSRRKN